MKITINSHEHRMISSRVPSFARAFYDRPFTNSDNQSVGAGELNGNYTAQVAVTYSNGIAQIASFSGVNQLDSCLVSTSGHILATATLALYDSAGSFIEIVYENIKIPEAPTTTTWANLNAVSSAITIPYRAEYYNREQIDRLLSNISGSPLASDAVIGRVRLDVAPASLSDPVAVGVNSPLLQQLGQSLNATYGNSLVAAVAAIGSTPTTLLVDADATLSVPVTIPSTLNLEQKNGAKITLTGAGAIAFAGKGILGSESPFFTASSQPGKLWFNNGQVNFTTDVITFTNHGYLTGQQVRYRQNIWENWPVLGGLSDGGLYYAIRIDNNNFKLATSYANALANTAVNLTTTGTSSHFLFAAPIAWTGPDWPDEVSSELIDTGTNSVSKRIELLTNGLAGKTVRFLVYPRTITIDVAMADKHSITLKKGVHANTFAGSPQGFFGAFGFPFMMGSDAEFTSEPGATFMETSVNFFTTLVAIRRLANNSSIHHNYFKGQGAFHNGVNGGCQIDSGNNNSIHHNYFEQCSSYLCSISPGTPGDLPSNCHIHHNIIYRTVSQVLFIAVGNFCSITDNYITCKDWTTAPATSFSFIDLEPNNESVITDCEVSRNVIDYRGCTNAGFIISFIRCNPAGTRGMERISVKDNVMIGNDLRGAYNERVRNGIEIIGTDQFEVSGNRTYGITSLAAGVFVEISRRGRIFNNTFTNGGGNIGITGSVDIEVFENRFAATPEAGTAQIAIIDESGFSPFPIDSATTNSIHLTYAVSFSFYGNIEQHFVGLRGYINNVLYTITSVTPGSFITGDGHATATLDRNMVEPVSFTVTAADVNTVTDTITKVAHGLNAGASVYYQGGTAAIGGLNSFAPYWVIKTGADTFKLADSYNNAVNGIAVNLTGTGSGTQTFYITFVLFSYNNEFANNLMPITSAPYSNIVDRTDYKGMQNVTAETILDNSKSGQTYENSGTTSGLIIKLPSNAVNGQEFKFCVMDNHGILVRATGKNLIRTGAILTGANGFVFSRTVGKETSLKKINSTTWVQDGFDGYNVSAATVVQSIDSGRTSGGTVSGWLQDTGFTGGSAIAVGSFTWDTSNVESPPPNDVFNTSRNGAFQYDFTGLDNTKVHIVRLHFGVSSIGGLPNYYQIDITINGVVAVTQFKPNYEVVSDLSTCVVDYPVASGVTAINVTFAVNPAGSGTYVSGVQCLKIP